MERAFSCMDIGILFSETTCCASSVGSLSFFSGIDFRTLGSPLGERFELFGESFDAECNGDEENCDCKKVRFTNY